MSRIAAAPLASLVAILSFAAGAGPAADSNAVSNSVSRGKGVALEICSICHVVARNQRDAPVFNQPTPSFEAVANDPNTTAKSLRRFITTTHWDENSTPMTMPHYDLTARQVDDVTAYILSLRKHFPQQNSGSDQH